MYAKKNKKPMYGKGGMAKLAQYMEGGKFPDLTGDGKVTMADILKGRGVKKYENGGEVDPDLTFILRENQDGGQDVLFMADGRPVTNLEAINYYASNMGPKEEFNEWFSQTAQGKYGDSQNVDMILSQMKIPGYKPGMTRSSGLARAQREETGDLRSFQGGTEGMEGRSREDRAKKLLSGLADYRKPR